MTSHDIDRPLTRREAEQLRELLEHALKRLAPTRALSVPEVAEQLSISRAGVYNLFNAGQLPRTKVGRSVRVLQADVDAFLERSRR